MTILYLAAPYSDPSPGVRQVRVQWASTAAAYLMKHGFTVFSPITHGHTIADHLPEQTRLDHDFWMKQCLPFLDRSHALIILPLSGWERSRGVRTERRRAEDLNLPELFMPLLSLESPDAFLSLIKETLS